jgi:hypothetical protein
VLTRAKRGALLERLARLAGADRITKAFQAVGATRPVELAQD